MTSKDCVGWGDGNVLHSVYQIIWANVVCAALYYKNITEHDPNVLHALKIGQYTHDNIIGTDFNSKLTQDLHTNVLWNIFLEIISHSVCWSSLVQTYF